MSCTSVGFIQMERKPVFEILSAITDSLRIFGASEINPARVYISTEYVTIDFNYQLDKRMLSIHFDCDSDYSDMSYGPKVIFSLGAVADGPEIIRQLCIDLSQFGRVFYTPNDCDHDPEEIGILTKQYSATYPKID